MKYVISYQTDR